MIKITHPNKPKILIDNEVVWTLSLLTLISKYGSYSKIPETEKASALRHYKNQSFVEEIFMLSNRKCTFCESEIETASYLNVEHFYPKSIHPKFTFKWTNLIPSCQLCNSKKSDFDTKKEPFVNPMKDEPDDYFVYSECRIDISPTAPDKIKAENTIKACNLKRVALSRTYATIIPTIYSVSDTIETAIEAYHKLSRKSAKIKKLESIFDSLENILELSRPGKAHAAFMRCMLRKISIFSEAIDLINSNLKELGLSEPLSIGNNTFLSC